MTDNPCSDRFSDLPSLKRLARRFLADRGVRGATDHEIARACLGARRIPQFLAGKLAQALLQEDLRFQRGENGRWTPAAPAGEGLPLEKAVFTVVDVETTGTSSAHRIIEIGAVRVEGLQIRDTYETLIDAGRIIPEFITAMTGITQDMVDGAPGPAEALGGLIDFLGDTVFTAHNAPFDRGFVYREARQWVGTTLENPVLCTRLLARRTLPELGRYSLDALVEELDYKVDIRHRGLSDALAAAHILLAGCQRMLELGVTTLSDLLLVQRKADFDRYFKAKKKREQGAEGA